MKAVSTRFPKTLTPVAAALALAGGCDSSSPTMTPTPPAADMAQAPRPLLALAGTDFTTGALSTVDPSSHAVTKNVDVIDAQSVVRAFGSKLYVLDQTHGSLRTYDATQGLKNPVDSPISKTGVVDGAQANPHDIYIDAARQRAYVSLYGGSGGTQVNASRALAVIDLTAPAAGISSFIALTTAAADTDGNPEADRLIACGDTLYIVLQDLDRKNFYAPTGPGRLAALSLTNPGTPSYIQLAGQNPTAIAVPAGCTEAVVGSAGNQYAGVLTGTSGIERVDLAGRKSLGLAMTDMDLGGNVSTLDAIDASHVFADIQVKSGMTFNNTVYLVDAVAKHKGAALLGPMSFVPAVRIFDTTLAVLSAGTAGTGQLAPGLYLGQTTGAPLSVPGLDVGLPPQSVALVYE